MSIINTGNLLQFRNGQAGRNCIKINSAYGIHFFEKQKEEETEIVFKIEQLSFIEPAPDPRLLIIFFS